MVLLAGGNPRLQIVWQTNYQTDDDGQDHIRDLPCTDGPLSGDLGQIDMWTPQLEAVYGLSISHRAPRWSWQIRCVIQPPQEIAKPNSTSFCCLFTWRRHGSDGDDGDDDGGGGSSTFLTGGVCLEFRLCTLHFPESNQFGPKLVLVAVTGADGVRLLLSYFVCSLLGGQIFAHQMFIVSHANWSNEIDFQTDKLCINTFGRPSNTVLSWTASGYTGRWPKQQTYLNQTDKLFVSKCTSPRLILFLDCIFNHGLSLLVYQTLEKVLFKGMHTYNNVEILYPNKNC